MPGAEGQGQAGSAGLQFDTVEADGEAAQPCTRCKQPIVGEYFEAAGNLLCRRCATLFGAGAAGTGTFLRALGYGAGAALVGTIVWFGFTKLTGSELGIIAIALGLFVGLAVRKGSGGQGGWKYQALAMGLTYISITSSYVPYVVKGLAEGAEHRHQEQAKKAASGETTSASSEAAHPESKPSAMPIVLAFVFVFALAFASPFLAGAQNIMGLIIIGIALYEAWKINKRVPLSGPFRIASRAQAPPPANPVAPSA
jgi:hypothetical protein